MVFFLPVLSGPIGVDLHVCVLPGRSRSAGNGVQHVWAIRTGLCMRQSPAALVASGTSEMPSLATWPLGPGASADPIRLQHSTINNYPNEQQPHSCGGRAQQHAHVRAR